MIGIPPQFETIEVEAGVVETDDGEKMACVILKMITADQAGLTGMMIVDEHLYALIRNLNVAADAALDRAAEL